MRNWRLRLKDTVNNTEVEEQRKAKSIRCSRKKKKRKKKSRGQKKKKWRKDEKDGLI